MQRPDQPRDHSTEQVYRAYGFEAKAPAELMHHVSLNAGLTKIWPNGKKVKDGDELVHFVANAAAGARSTTIASMASTP